MGMVLKRIRLDIRHLIGGGFAEIVLGAAGYHLCLSSGWEWPKALVAGALPALCGVFRLVQGVRRKWQIEALGINSFTSRTLAWIEALKARQGLHKTLYLGDGFLWGPEHCQAFHEVDELPDKARHFPLLQPEGGLPYIHAIGRLLTGKDKPQCHSLPEHTAIIGTTGIGKTRTFELILAQLIRRGDPVIVIDPKSDKDLLDAVYQATLDAGRAESFDYVSLAHPQISEKINPFATYSTASEVAGRITSIMPKTGSSQPFTDFCGDVLTTVAEVLILMGEQITLRKLYKYAVLERESLLDKALEFEKTAKLTPEGREQLYNTIGELRVKIEHDKGHFAKMTTSLMPILKALTSGNIGAVLNPKPTEGLSWSRIIQEKRVVYFSLASMKDAYVSTNVGKLVVQDLVAYIGNQYTRTVHHQPLHLVVDEFYSVVYEGYVDIFNKCRAAGLRLYIGLQTTADIEARLDDAVRRQIYGNLANKLYMRIPDSSQAEELVATLGTCKVPKQTRTRNVSASLHGVDDLFRSGFSERVDLADTELLPVSVLTSLPRGHAILVTQGYPPIKISIPLLDRTGLPRVSFFEKVIGFYRNDADDAVMEASLFEMDPPLDEMTDIASLPANK